jgi:hypothetical protein
MKIFTIELKEFGYDFFVGHTIVANSDEQVRELAKSVSAAEGQEVWNKAEVIECGDYTYHRTEPFILMSDFRGY